MTDDEQVTLTTSGPSGVSVRVVDKATLHAEISAWLNDSEDHTFMIIGPA